MINFCISCAYAIVGLMLPNVDEEIHISITIIVSSAAVVPACMGTVAQEIGAFCCTAGRSLLPSPSIPISPSTQVSSVFVMFSVVDAVIYENTLELVAAIVLGALCACPAVWTALISKPADRDAAACRLLHMLPERQLLVVQLQPSVEPSCHAHASHAALLPQTCLCWRAWSGLPRG